MTSGVETVGWVEFWHLEAMREGRDAGDLLGEFLAELKAAREEELARYWDADFMEDLIVRWGEYLTEDEYAQLDELDEPEATKVLKVLHVRGTGSMREMTETVTMKVLDTAGQTRFAVYSQYYVPEDRTNPPDVGADFEMDAVDVDWLRTTGYEVVQAACQGGMRFYLVKDSTGGYWAATGYGKWEANTVCRRLASKHDWEGWGTQPQESCGGIQPGGLLWPEVYWDGRVYLGVSPLDVSATKVEQVGWRL